MNNYDRSVLNSELLRTFCAVAETGNVTQAAALLSRTQSAISVQIRKLEEHLSVVLFERQARGVVLSDDGKKLLPVAEKALAEMGRVNDLFSVPLAGRVRVGIPDDYNETILENALAQFCKRHRNVEVFVQSGCTAGFPDAIRKNQLDIAIYSAEAIPKQDAFYSEPTCWVASVDYILQENEPIPLAMFDRDCWWRNVPTDALDSVNRRWRIAYLSENFASVKAAIRSGLAVGILAKSAVAEGMKILREKEGFPPLPNSSLQLLKSNNNVSSEIVQEMERSIHTAIN